MSPMLPTSAWMPFGLTGDFDQVEEQVRAALQRVDPDKRQDTMASYTGPHRFLLSLDILDSATREFVQTLLGRVLEQDRL